MARQGFIYRWETDAPAWSLRGGASYDVVDGEPEYTQSGVLLPSADPVLGPVAGLFALTRCRAWALAHGYGCVKVLP